MAWKMDHPSIALNQHVITHGKARVWPFDLDVNVVFDKRESPASVLKHVQKRIFIAMVVNCHGAPAMLELGSGITPGNAHLFRSVRRHVKEIWFSSCNVAGSQKGKDMCQSISDTSEAYVVASSELQKQSHRIGKGEIRAMNKPVYLFTPGAKDPEEYNYFRPDIPDG